MYVIYSVLIVTVVAEVVSDYPDVPLVLDPVFASGRGDEFAGEDMVSAIRELLVPQSTVVTPNIPELRRLGPGSRSDRHPRCTSNPPIAARPEIRHYHNRYPESVHRGRAVESCGIGEGIAAARALECTRVCSWAPCACTLRTPVPSSAPSGRHSSAFESLRIHAGPPRYVTEGVEGSTEADVVRVLLDDRP